MVDQKFDTLRAAKHYAEHGTTEPVRVVKSRMFGSKIVYWVESDEVYRSNVANGCRDQVIVRYRYGNVDPRVDA